MNKQSVKFSIVSVVIVLALVWSDRSFSAAQGTPPTPAATAAPQEVTFPALTGQYTVGRTEYEWVDQSRDETFASIPGLKRDLMVTVWFPASVTKRTKIAPYMDSGPVWDVSALGQAKPYGMGLVAHPGLNSMIHSHAYTSSILDTSQSSYPVLIFVHDLDADAFYYASILEDIASHGYIVIATSHPYSDDVIRYPDGRLVLAGSIGQAVGGGNIGGNSFALLQIWIQDVQFVLDQTEKLNATDPNFKGHLDLVHIGVFGMSFGGTTAIKVAAADPRVKAGVTLEALVEQANLPVQLDPGNKPFLYVGLGFVPDTEQQSQDKFWLTIDGMDGMNYGDFGLLASLIPEMNGYIGSINPARGLQIVNSYLVAFFDHYLKGTDLNWPTYPEAHLHALKPAAPAG